MRTLKYLITAAMATAIAFASCTKEIDISDSEDTSENEIGEPIEFGVSTGYDNEPETKVEYSGVVINNKERINWELDDRLEIFYNQAPVNKKAEYKISGNPSSSGSKSTASIEKAGATGLVWANGSEHIFSGVYPKTGAGNTLRNRIISTKADSFNGITIEAEVPNVQEPGNEPIMTAFTKIDGNGNVPVNLAFSPAVNTFDLYITNQSNSDVSLKSVELLSPLTRISGKYEISFASYNGVDYYRKYDFAKNRASQTKSVIYEYVIPHLLERGKSVSIRLYTLPKKLEQLTLVLNFTTGKSINWEIKNTDNTWLSFEKERKYNFVDIKFNNIKGKSWKYNFELERPDSLIFAPFSLKYPYRSCEEPLTAQAKVKSTYNIPFDFMPKPAPWGCSKDYPWASYANSNVYEGGSNWSTFYLRFNGSHPGELKNPELWQQLEQWRRRTYPDHNDFLDLSGTGARQNTANCYIINKPGLYKFPLVYGNAIKNGQTNSEAYTPLPVPNPQSTFKKMWMAGFIDGTGKIITGPNITDAKTVEVIWTDIKSNTLKLNGLKIENGYVKFSIGRLPLSEGNYLIAVKDKNGTIIWTWHIWVIPDYFISYGKFLSKPLGSLPNIGGTHKFAENVEINQLDAKGKRDYLWVQINSTYGYEDGLYYTLGRMTPSLKALGRYYKYKDKRITTFASQYDKNGNDFVFNYQLETNTIRMKEAISNPQKIFMLSNKIIPLNIWERDPLGNKRVKTVYDPCPAKYRVPTLSETTGANLSAHLLGRLSRPSGNISVSIEDYMIRAYFLHTTGFSAYPNEGDMSDGFKYMPILPIKE